MEWPNMRHDNSQGEPCAISLVSVEGCPILCIKTNAMANTSKPHRAIVPLFFPQPLPPPDGAQVLATDIGGTKTDLAVFEIRDGLPELLRSKRYPSAEWPSLVGIVRDFHREEDCPQRMCISFAGPIQGGKAHGTNLHWDIDRQEIAEKLGIGNVYLINDLEANCYGLAALKPADLQTVYAAKNPMAGNAAVLSPGTGLGEGGLFWDGAAYRPFATEGGHAHFAPRNELDWELSLHLGKKYGHVSWERVVSGIGIQEIFTFLRDVKKMETTEAHAASIPLLDTAEAIAATARQGCPVCRQTLSLFVRYLAEESANLALKLKASGGLYLGGGILPNIWNDEYQAIFHQFFFAVGRLHPLVEAVPVYLILNPKTALWGAAYYGAFGKG